MLEENHELAVTKNDEVKGDGYETVEGNSIKGRKYQMREENYNVEDMSVDKLDKYLCEVTKKDKDDKVGIIKLSDREIPAVDASSAGETKNCSDDSDIT